LVFHLKLAKLLPSSPSPLWLLAPLSPPNNFFLNFRNDPRERNELVRPSRRDIGLGAAEERNESGPI